MKDGHLTRAARRAFGSVRRRLGRDSSHRAYTPPPHAEDPTPVEIRTVGHVPVMPGQGDTPGPNCKTEISVDWLAAQVISGVAPLVIDLRPLSDFRNGHVPGAVPVPRSRLPEVRSLLPGAGGAVVVYDEQGGPAAGEAASWVRGETGALCRFLNGGWQGWLEANETVETPPREGVAPGVTVTGGTGRRGFLLMSRPGRPPRDWYALDLEGPGLFVIPGSEVEGG